MTKRYGGQEDIAGDGIGEEEGENLGNVDRAGGGGAGYHTDCGGVAALR